MGRIIYITILLCLLIVLLIPDLHAERPKIGLVLSGGGARGIAHIGVLRVLDSLNVPVDYIVGTSMGSIVGGLYALGYTPQELDSLSRSINWPVLFSDTPLRTNLSYLEKWDTERFQLTLSMEKFRIKAPSGLISGQKVSQLLNRLTVTHSETSDFNKLPIPFHCVAVDLITGNEVILSSGYLAKAIRSSMSIPSIFTPVEWGDSLLIDGGVLNNLPVDVVKKMGAEFIIAVNVGTPLKPREEINNVVDVLMQSFGVAAQKKEQENLRLADIVITPDLEGYSISDFINSKIPPMIKRGMLAARAHVPELQLLSQPAGLDEGHLGIRISFENGIIYGVYITGNEKLSFSFIYQLLGLKPGQYFDTQILEKRIEYLYSLGYFQKIDYRLEKEKEQQYRLYLSVEEKPGALLRFGFRYEDDKKGVLGINARVKDLPFPGILNDMTVLFSGLQLWEWQLSYPRRLWGNYIYPYLYSFYQDIPTYIYSDKEKIARYHKRSFGGAIGLGFIIKNWGELRVDYMPEKLLVSPSIAFSPGFEWPEWKYNVHLGRIYFDVDLLDATLTPQHGYWAQLGYEQNLDFINQRENTNRIYLEQRFYGTLFRHNISSIQLFFGFTKNAEFYRYFYLGGAYTFVGYNYDEFSGPNVGIYRFEHRYQWHNIISLVGIFNAGNIWEDYRNIRFKENFKTGYGIGIQIDSFLGPFRYVLSFSRDHTIQYFTLGYTLATQNDKRK
ncbi:MAG: patatin-like phospholipase family protein [bacterium]|nr:MAG: patatin-like phospholipase family protein [bacterium]